MKKIVMLALCAAMLLTGCTSGSYTKDYMENTADDSWTVSYGQFDGVKTITVPMDEEKETVFAVDVVTDSGALAITITGADGTQYYTGNKMPSTSFTVQAGQNGPYTIQVEAERHSGSFAISWKAAE